ncbi:hypothetical protein Hypma_002309 [Hypsizygus marmoreus]|uniref:Uncharacterized protein n=1 Tax=Hypsizygus marmoreus TaxID=39966 RepID=A0A369K7Q2_HYPMA|nr:hypothetical protein Hypma_002309 [Hypsizygus marmoreus]
MNRALSVRRRPSPRWSFNTDLFKSPGPYRYALAVYITKKFRSLWNRNETVRFAISALVRGASDYKQSQWIAVLKMALSRSVGSCSVSIRSRKCRHTGRERRVVLWYVIGVGSRSCCPSHRRATLFHPTAFWDIFHLLLTLRVIQFKGKPNLWITKYI